MAIGLGCWVFDLFREKGIFLPHSQHWIIHGILNLPLEKEALPDASDKILNVVGAGVTWPSRSCAMLEGELWQPPAWIFLPLCAARFTAPQTWGNYIQKGTSQKYHAVKWIAAFVKTSWLRRLVPNGFWVRAWFFSIRKLKKGRGNRECVIISSGRPYHQAILVNSPPPLALTCTAQDCLQPTSCQAWLSTTCTRQALLSACCCWSGLSQLQWQTCTQTLPKAKPHVEGTVCSWTCSRLSKSSFFLHVLKQEPGNLSRRFFYWFFLILFIKD